MSLPVTSEILLAHFLRTSEVRTQVSLLPTHFGATFDPLHFGNRRPSSTDTTLMPRHRLAAAQESGNKPAPVPPTTDSDHPPPPSGEKP